MSDQDQRFMCFGFGVVCGIALIQLFWLMAGGA